MKVIKIFFLLLLLGVMLIGGYILLVVYPNMLFSHSYEYKNFRVFSDKSIPIEIEQVLHDAKSRIEKSELYEDTDIYDIYFCNDNWRLKLLTTKSKVGGAVYLGLSNNVFIRESNIKKNKIISPNPNREILYPEQRPLSYYIAHEVTHNLSAKLDRYIYFNTPFYIIEGYADYIGKAPDFDFDIFLEHYKANDPSMGNGMYNKYHLMIAYLIDKKDMSFADILEQRPSFKKTQQSLEQQYNIENK